MLTAIKPAFRQNAPPRGMGSASVRSPHTCPGRAGQPCGWLRYSRALHANSLNPLRSAIRLQSIRASELGAQPRPAQLHTPCRARLCPPSALPEAFRAQGQAVAKRRSFYPPWIHDGQASATRENGHGSLHRTRTCSPPVRPSSFQPVSLAVTLSVLDASSAGQ